MRFLYAAIAVAGIALLVALYAAFNYVPRPDRGLVIDLVFVLVALYCLLVSAIYFRDSLSWSIRITVLLLSLGVLGFFLLIALSE